MLGAGQVKASNFFVDPIRFDFMDPQLRCCCTAIAYGVCENAHNVVGCPSDEVTLQTDEDVDVGLELLLEQRHIPQKHLLFILNLFQRTPRLSGMQKGIIGRKQREFRCPGDAVVSRHLLDIFCRVVEVKDSMRSQQCPHLHQEIQ